MLQGANARASTSKHKRWHSVSGIYDELCTHADLTYCLNSLHSLGDDGMKATAVSLSSVRSIDMLSTSLAQLVHGAFTCKDMGGAAAAAYECRTDAARAQAAAAAASLGGGCSRSVG